MKLAGFLFVFSFAALTYLGCVTVKYVECYNLPNICMQPIKCIFDEYDNDGR